MKWAPNKKLHFEVAIIKAIQSLGQATLDEVIEKLGELRDGGTTRPPATAEVTPAKPSALRTKPVAAGADRGLTKPVAQRAGVIPTSRDYSGARVEEEAASVDSEKIWQAVLAKIPAQKAFVRNSASVTHVLGVEGRIFRLGFAPADKAAMDILGTPANRKFVEALLHEITGKDWTMKLTVNEELAPKSTAVAEDLPNDFKDEPVIQEAIELFNARVKS
jgi:DNA polymerase-3 subunit gamma/tau